MATPSPIGALYLDAQKKAAKKKAASPTTTESTTCGCRVTVTPFSKESHSVKFEPCPEHYAKQERKKR